MRVTFFDDPDDDSGRWDTELSLIPCMGEMVILPGARIGRVVAVRWCLEDTPPHVEITVTLL